MMHAIDYVPYLEDDIKAEDLTVKQKQQLFTLNKVLTQLELDIKQQAILLIAECNRKLGDNHQWLEEYEIELEVSFWLKESDSAFDDDKDNILVALTELLSPCDFSHGVADGINHNEFKNWDWHPLKDGFHCWLYHCLYDHSRGMDWANMLRIGKIWTDIHCRLQSFINLEDDS